MGNSAYQFALALPKNQRWQPDVHLIVAVMHQVLLPSVQCHRLEKSETTSGSGYLNSALRTTKFLDSPDVRSMEFRTIIPNLALGALKARSAQEV